MNKYSRVMIVAILILALGASGLTRWFAQERRNAALYGNSDSASPTEARSRLSSMNSYALALLLGGLRGPLVMILWSHSEQQKGENDLEGIDTQIEWIRLLQPEFDSVHIFQIWNKAYNLSVQMASVQNKYTTILDAMDYAFSVDRERPNDINIITSIAQIYADKLGSSSEKAFYRKWVREQTRASQSNIKAASGSRRLRLDPLLDESGKILPSCLTGNIPELPYLPQYEPYPYGLSPFALSYNYYKRAQILQAVGKQRHVQMSELVIDSRPAHVLKSWSEEERERALAAELTAFGRPPVGEAERDTAAASLNPAEPVRNIAAFNESVYSYHQAARLCDGSLAEFERHLKGTPLNYDTYQSIMADMRAAKVITQADENYLRLVQQAGGGSAADYRAGAIRDYSDAFARYAVILLKYYTEREILDGILPAGINRDNIDRLMEEPLRGQLPKIMVDQRRERARLYASSYDPHVEDSLEYERYLARCSQRLMLLGK